jgi:hypothetical protein
VTGLSRTHARVRRGYRFVVVNEMIQNTFTCGIATFLRFDVVGENINNGLKEFSPSNCH